MEVAFARDAWLPSLTLFPTYPLPLFPTYPLPLFPSSPLFSSGVLRTVLPNGLTLLVQHVPDSPAVGVVTRVRAGFFDEPDEWQGISHVLEHMFFKGTPSRGVGEIAREIRSAGGYLNAATSYDYTAYYAVLPVRGLATAIQVQADALRHASLDPDEFRREIRVIIEEAKRKLDSPGAVAQETLHALLFDRHRIRRWRIGTEEGLLRLTPEDLRAYYRSRYVPDRVVVAICGGMDPDEALRLGTSAFGDWDARPRDGIMPSEAEPPRSGLRVRTLRGDVRQATLVVGWRGVPALHPDGTALDVAATVLGTGRAGRLYRAVRETGLASSVGAWSYSPTEVGVFSLAAETDVPRLRQTLHALTAQVARLASYVPAPQEVERARMILRTRWARRFESVEGRASELAAAESLGDLGILDREYQELLECYGELVTQAVSRHLQAPATAAVAYLPESEESGLTVEDLGDGLSDPGPGSPFEAPRGVVVVASRPSSGQHTAGVLHVALPDCDLLLRNRPGTPTATIGVYRVRRSADPADLAGLGALAIRSAVRGAGPWDARGLAEVMEALGGTLGTVVASDWVGFGTSVLAENLAPAATLLRTVLEQPSLGAEQVRIEQGHLLDDARNAEDDMFRHPIQLALRAAFGAAAYGIPALGWPSTVPNIGPADVRRWHDELLEAGRTTVVAVGEFDPEDAADLLAGVFAGDTRAEALEAGVAAGPWQPAEAVMASRDKAQTALAMLFPGPDRLSPERHTADVWSSWSGGLGGQLFEALRDRRSLAYTVAAFPWQKRRVGGLLTYIATSPDREAEAREAMLEELDGMAREAPSASAITGAVEYLVGQAEVRRQSAAAMAAEMIDAWFQGTGLEELEDPAGPYRAVRPADIQALVARYLRAELRVEGGVRGRQGSPATAGSARG